MGEQERNDSTSPFKRPDGVPTDIVIFTIITTGKNRIKKSLPKRELQILLIQRKVWPFKGKWALPGGFTRETENVHECARRELMEETGVDGVHVEYFNVYSAPGRDPRGWIISHAYYALVNEQVLANRQAATDAEDVRLFSLDEALSMDLAFDHRQILQDALHKIQMNMLTTTIARQFLPEEFTISELYQVIQTVVPAFEEKNFIRKITSTQSRQGIIEEVRDRSGEWKVSNQYSQRAAQLYRFSGLEPQLSIYK